MHRIKDCFLIAAGFLFSPHLYAWQDFREMAKVIKPLRTACARGRHLLKFSA